MFSALRPITLPSRPFASHSSHALALQGNERWHMSVLPHTCSRRLPVWKLKGCHARGARARA